MDYDFRGRSGSGSGSGSYGAPPGGGGGPGLYPRVGQPMHGGVGSTASPRAPPYSHGPPAAGSAAPVVTPLAPASSASSKMGINVMIKPEYRITPPPQLPPHMAEIPRSTFNFDFEFERKILAEAEKENPNWSKFVIERPTAAPAPVTPQTVPQQTRPASSGDPVVDKYVAMGFGREAVSFAVLNFGDNPAKVKEFVKSYNILHEMGFTSTNVPELLAIHDNDPDKVIQRLLSSPS